MVAGRYAALSFKTRAVRKETNIYGGPAMGGTHGIESSF